MAGCTSTSPFASVTRSSTPQVASTRFGAGYSESKSNTSDGANRVRPQGDRPTQWLSNAFDNATAREWAGSGGPVNAASLVEVVGVVGGVAVDE